MIASERLINRAITILSRPGAWLEPSGSSYLVRPAPDRRRRPLLSIDSAAFEALTREPGLKAHAHGYKLARVPPLPSVDEAARPGFIDGERLVADADGRLTSRTVNLGESPIAWLARRKDANGQPWLTPAEIAAAERLREDFYRAGTVGRLTMHWDGRPSAGSGGGPRLDPAERARAAKARIAAALEAVGPGLREIVERICFLGSALDAAERELGLPRRSGKTVLKLALGRLAVHYRLG